MVYPEITDGNPLGLENVVRWLLHQPGFHTGRVNYGQNELYFKFNSAIRDFQWEGSELSQIELKIIYYFTHYYHSNNIAVRDIECCYMVRKGTNKPFIHSENSICIDNLSHEQTAAIFRRSKRFICYDDYTAYSIFAILCGCESIVVPDEKVSLEQWYPNEQDRYGIAYGLDESQLTWARETRDKVIARIESEHKKSEDNVKAFIKELERYFFNLS